MVKKVETNRSMGAGWNAALRPLRALGLYVIPPILSLILIPSAQGAGSDLDTGFNGTGTVVTSISSNDSAYAAAVQTDGKIVAVGYATGSDKDFALVRYNADGSLDSTFGSVGIVTRNFNGFDVARDVAIQPDGKILVSGFNGFSGLLARFTSTGALDTSFGGVGFVTAFSVFQALALQTDGMIVVVGGTHRTPSAGSGDFAIARYDGFGNLDPSFGSGGLATVDIGDQFNEAYDVAIQADGKIVVSGISHSGTTWGPGSLVRLNSNGTPDGTFGSAGKITPVASSLPVPGEDKANGIAIQSDGKILVTGGNRLERYLTGGSLDPTFGSGAGWVFSPPISQGVALQTDGKIVVDGYSPWNSDTQEDTVANRYHPNGNIDFSSSYPFGTFMSDKAYAVTIQPDSKIILTGMMQGVFTNRGFLLRRLVGGAQSGDLSILKSASPSPVTVGQNLTYTLSIVNNGNDTHTEVLVEDTLPAGVTFVSVGTTQGSCLHSAGTVNCNLGLLLTGRIATVTIVVKTNTIGSITNTAEVTGSIPDPNLGNNSASVTTDVVPGPNPPVVNTGPATNVSESEAVLNGTANPGGIPGSAWFEWGLTDSYGNTTPPQPIAGSGPNTVSFGISGLNSNTTYHFRIVANNAGGTTHGGDLTFTTLLASPLAVYGEGSSAFPRYRTWNGSNWSSEKSALSAGVMQHWIVLRRNPVRTEALLGTLDHDYDLNVQAWNGSSWSSAIEITSSSSTKATRAFDIAYEAASGRGMLVYNDGSATPKYRIWNGGGWSSALSVPKTQTSLKPIWIRLESKPGSNEIVLAYQTDKSENRVNALVWNGSSWGNEQLMETKVGAYDKVAQSFDVAYEQRSGRGMVIWSEASKSVLQYRIWNGANWSAENGSGSPNQMALSSTTPIYFVKLAADPSSNQLAVGTADANYDFYVQVWSGSAWGEGSRSAFTLTPDLEYNLMRREYDLAFERTTGRLMAAYDRKAAVGSPGYYRTWTFRGDWSGEASLPPGAQDPAWVQLQPDPASNQIFVGLLDKQMDINFHHWDGFGWDSSIEVETTSSEGKNEWESFMITFLP